jgi:hypothetical protein
MNQLEAIQAADQVAGVAFSGAAHPFAFSEILSIGSLTMPEYLDRHREASAADLYHYLCNVTKEPVGQAWSDLPGNMRCAFEVYRATYAVLMRFVRDEELAAREREHGKLGGTVVVPLPSAVRRMFGRLRRCRVCGCTDDDCQQCIEKTGKPCHWVENDLCSACVTPASKAKAG